MKLKNATVVFLIFAASLSCKTSENLDLNNGSFNKETLMSGKLVLFNEVEVDLLSDGKLNEGEKRKRLVKVNPKIYRYNQLQIGQILIINLFNDLLLFAEVNRFRSGYKGIRTYSGSILSFDKTSFSLSLDNDMILLNIRHIRTGKIFEAFYSQKMKSHVVVEKEVDMNDVFEDEPAIKIDSLKLNRYENN